MRTVVSVFGLNPEKISSTEAFARELSLQLGQVGWQSVLCFASKPSPRVSEYLRLPNVQIEIVHDPWTATIRNVGQLKGVLQRHRPEILHLHLTGFLTPFPWLARLVGVRKVFFTDHGSRSAKYIPKRAPFWKRMITRVINFPMTGVTSGSHFGYECFKTMDVLPAERFRLIYNAVDLSRPNVSSEAGPNLRDKYSIPKDRMVVAQVSWIIPEKGIDVLLEAARLVIQCRDDVHFLIVGEGAYRGQYMRLTEQLGIAGHITWTGLVQDPFQEGVFSAADVVCQVSRWQELFGFTIAEAMASHKPVVGTRVGGIPEVIENGVTGFVVPTEDQTQVAQKIILLLEDKALRDKMGRAGRQAAECKFNLRRNVPQLLEFYGLQAHMDHFPASESLLPSGAGLVR